MKALKNILLVLSTGYIFVYFSENLFWAHIRVDDSFTNWLSTWLVYSLEAFVFLVLVSYFRVKGIWGLFLAGAIFGWLTEGVIVQTAYDALPLSISFTGLAWHAMITVWVGWYAIQKALLSSSAWASIKLASLIGFIQGVWAINWWVEPDGKVSSTSEFTEYAFVTTALVILAYWLANWSSSTTIKWNRWVIGLVAALFGLYFLFITVPTSPIAIVVLPILIGLAYWGLRQNRMYTTEGSLLAIWGGHISLRNYLGLFGLPVTSTIVYALAVSVNLKAHSNWIVYFITTLLGFIIFIVSLYKLRRQALVLKVMQANPDQSQSKEAI